MEGLGGYLSVFNNNDNDNHHNDDDNNSDMSRLNIKIFVNEITVQNNYANSIFEFSKEGRNVLFNHALNTFYVRLYGVSHMVKDHSDSERGNLLPPHVLLFPISSKGYFICIIPQTR